MRSDRSAWRPRQPVGFRLRQKRREQGITQAALATRAGISASYLNLIEHGRREVSGSLLRRLAGALQIELAELTVQEDTRLLQDVAEVATDSVLRDLQVEERGAQEIVGRRPEWARALVRLHRHYRRASTLAETLSHRLAHDATLVEATHELLTRMTSIRSFAEILQEHPEIDPDRRARFNGLIAEESARLGDIAKAVFDRLSDFGENVRATTPAEEVDDFIIDNANYFPELELRADRLRARLRESGASLEAALEDRLASRHGVRMEACRVSPDEPLDRRGSFDPVRQLFRYPVGVPPPTLRFQLARLAFGLEEGAAVAALVDDRRLTSETARERATGALNSYGAGAVIFPYDEFLAAAEQSRYDLDHLAALFGATTEQVCHRLVTLRRSEAEGIPFAFLRVDPAGNISKRFSLPGLRLPRFGGVCPLWPAYTALRSLGSPVTQRVRLADGREFLLIARAVSKPPPAYGMPLEIFSVMIGCDMAYADRIVYGDALRGDPSTAMETGINCHLCPRPACPQRAHPQLVMAG